LIFHGVVSWACLALEVTGSRLSSLYCTNLVCMAMSEVRGKHGGRSELLYRWRHQYDNWFQVWRFNCSKWCCYR